MNRVTTQKACGTLGSSLTTIKDIEILSHCDELRNLGPDNAVTITLNQNPGADRWVCSGQRRGRDSFSLSDFYVESFFP
jgi:hypothetical protein